MKKINLLIALVLCCSTAMADNHSDNKFVFDTQLKARTVTKPTDRRISPSEKAVRELQKTIASDSEEKLSKNKSGINVMKIARRASAKKTQKMDSLTRVLQNGNRVQKMSFEYDENGNPTFCYNYLPNNEGEWEYGGRTTIEYDELGRVIAQDYIDITGSSQGYRYEYEYPDESNRFDVATFYLYVNNILVPSQRAEYAYDDNYNITNEIHLLYDSTAGDWQYFEKAEASYDEESRMLTYFTYFWNTETQEWQGDSTSNAGQSFEYTEDGRDARISYYTWKDGDWLEYQRNIFVYDENGDLELDSLAFWNSTSQDWSGGDTYGNNVKTEYTYDSQHRCTDAMTYTLYPNSGWTWTGETTHEFALLESGETQDIQKVYFRWQSATPSLYAETEQHFLPSGFETYYIQYYYTSGSRRAQQEEIRHYDEYNHYLGGEFYGFTNDSTNRRYASIKEAFTYPDGCIYNTPIEGDHWNGTRDNDSTWTLDFIDYFEFGADSVLTSWHEEAYIDGVPYNRVGYYNTYDFDTPVENVARWYIPNKNQRFYNYKALTETTMVNNNYYMGDNEWDDSYSYTDTYYYSDLTADAINDVNTSDKNIVEIARYDVSGRQVDKNAKGVVIIKYSNGTIKKKLER
jgi:hypothetical protein